MLRKEVSPEVADKVYELLKEFGEKGGTWKDVFAATTYAESVCRDALYTLDKAGRAIRHGMQRGPGRGGLPDRFTAIKEEP